MLFLGSMNVGVDVTKDANPGDVSGVATPRILRVLHSGNSGIEVFVNL